MSIPTEHIPAGQAPPPTDAEIHELVSAFESHDFGADEEFRAGLPAVIKAIKGRGSSAAQIDDMIARAQWFYFTRLKGASIPFDTYLQNRSRETESQPMKSPTNPMRDIPPEAPEPAVPAAVAVEDAAATATPPPPHPSAAVTAAEVRIAEAASVAGEPVAAAASGPSPAVPAEEMKFSDIVRLIAEGRADEVPVPIIPDGINEEAPSVSTMKARPKPWERQGEVEVRIAEAASVAGEPVAAAASGPSPAVPAEETETVQAVPGGEQVGEVRPGV